jgi:hypothetical protein
MTPAEIAAKLTPAQVRALRDLPSAGAVALFSLCDFEDEHLSGFHLFDVKVRPFAPTKLGRAVLAELDAAK